jgi:hypothetical protein
VSALGSSPEADGDPTVGMSFDGVSGVGPVDQVVV